MVRQNVTLSVADAMNQFSIRAERTKKQLASDQRAEGGGDQIIMSKQMNDMNV